MSTDATTPSKKPNSTDAASDSLASNGSPNKGKGKAARDEDMDEDEEDEDDEDDDDDEDMEEEEEEDEFEEIDPSVILPSRRTRGVKVDYTSKEALEKAGLKPETADEEGEDSYTHEDSSMDN